MLQSESRTDIVWARNIHFSKAWQQMQLESWNNEGGGRKTWGGDIKLRKARVEILRASEWWSPVKTGSALSCVEMSKSEFLYDRRYNQHVSSLSDSFWIVLPITVQTFCAELLYSVWYWEHLYYPICAIIYNLTIFLSYWLQMLKNAKERESIIRSSPCWHIPFFWVPSSIWKYLNLVAAL